MSNLNHLNENKSNNVFKTWLYLLFFGLLVSSLGFILAVYFNNSLFLYSGFAVSIGMSLWSYWFSDKAVLRMAGAKQINQEDNIELFERVRMIATKAKLPMPKVYIMNDPSPNAFATGRNPQNSAVAFTTGILALLNKEELDGVIAHELSHIQNRDTLIMTVVGVMASFISFVANFMMFAGGGDREENSNVLMYIVSLLVAMFLLPMAAMVVQMAISRKREFVADAHGALMVDNAQGLADALVKISSFPIGMQKANPSISHLFISNPEKLDTQEGLDERRVHWFAKFFMTHPPVGERVSALLGR